MELSELFTKPSFIFDIICIAALLIIALVYARKGFAAGVVQFAGTLVSLVGGRLVADWAAPVIFTRFLAPNFITRVTEMIGPGNVYDLGAIVQEHLGFLPESIVEPVVASLEGSLSLALCSTAESLAQVIVSDLIAPLFTPVIAIVLFFVAFTLLRMAASFLVTLLSNLNKLPVLGGVNYWLGFAAGLLAGLLDVFLVLCVVWALIVITGGGLPFLNDAALADSIVYRLFGRINPFM